MRLLALSEGKSDVLSYYRCGGILKDLCDQLGCEYDLYDIAQAAVSWQFFQPYDLVFVQRPQHGNTLSICQLLKRMDIPIWMDYDDDILHMRRGHEQFAAYSRAGEYFKSLMALADVFTVSTKHLADSFIPYCKDIVIVPNALPKKFYTHKEVNKEGVTLWRGSHHHLSDLYEFRDELQGHLDREMIYFMGINPFFLHKYMVHEPLDLLRYYEFGNELKPKKVIFPIVDSQFNRSVSNNVWLEATMFGAVLFASQLPEFKMPGIVDFKNFGGDFPDDDLQMFYDISYEYITENLTLEIVNKQRVEIVNHYAQK